MSNDLRTKRHRHRTRALGPSPEATREASSQPSPRHLQPGGSSGNLAAESRMHLQRPRSQSGFIVERAASTAFQGKKHSHGVSPGVAGARAAVDSHKGIPLLPHLITGQNRRPGSHN